MISEALRTAVRESGATVYSIAQRTGLPKNTVSHFLKGNPTSLEKAEKIAVAIGKSLRIGGKLRNSG